MRHFPNTIILRHRKENLKKCSLTGLEQREDLRFFSYPWKEPKPDLTNYVVLGMNAKPLSMEDTDKGLFLIDGTWSYACKMQRSLKSPFEMRSIPEGFVTAYPRKQDDCENPIRGLASVEALYIAYFLLGRETDGLLDHYY